MTFLNFKVLPSQRQSQTSAMYIVSACLQKEHGWDH